MVLASSMMVSVSAQQVAWRDPSSHQIQFVTDADGVRLEALDWGGSGRAVVLLAGSGNTAHVFDEFAPKLSTCCHVYGIPGADSAPPARRNPAMTNSIWRTTSCTFWTRCESGRR
jgi:hypothetical protein